MISATQVAEEGTPDRLLKDSLLRQFPYCVPHHPAIELLIGELEGCDRNAEIDARPRTLPSACPPVLLSAVKQQTLLIRTGN